MSVYVCMLCCTAFQVQEKVSGFRTNLDQVRGLQPRVSRTSQLCRDLEELDARIGSEKSKLGGSDSSRSHLLVNRELQEAQMKAWVLVAYTVYVWRMFYVANGR